jgi:uncharacterized membrane protein
LCEEPISKCHTFCDQLLRSRLSLTDWFLQLTAGDRAASYQEAWFAFDVAGPLAFGVLIVVFCASLAFWQWRLRGNSKRWTLVILRALALTLALFLLLGPTLVARRLEPGTHFVPILFDDSRSMTVPDGDGKTRGARLVDAYDASSFERTLKQTHQVAQFRFGGRTERANDIRDLTFDQGRSDIVGAVDGVYKQMSGATVSAVVVFSDGVQQSAAPARLADLPRDVPVFVVGVGIEDRWRDLVLADVSVSHVQSDEVAVTAHVVTHGLADEDVVIETLNGTRVVASSSLSIVRCEEENYMRLSFGPQGDGWRAYRVRVRLADTTNVWVKDRIAANNARDFLVDNREQTFRILHFSGRPNWESKFLRRSLQGAPQLALSSLIRISGPERKFVFRGRDATMANPLFEGFDDQALNAPRYDEAVFIRIGVAESELAVGYPLEASELFRYHLVIWGDVERDFFSLEHLELTREFVTKRGGSFLMLGGPQAFAEGGWAHSVIEPMLPVVLGSAGNHDDVAFRAKPTIEGLLSGVWSLDEDAAVNVERWANLSALYGVNAFVSVRAGATVMAEIEAESEAVDGQPLFAWQRYGEGLSAVLATGETWPWQMMEDVEDTTHERFWRQLARLLVSRVSEPVTMVDGGEDAVVEEVRQLKFMVRDSLFELREGLAVGVQVTGADGGIENLPVSESIAEVGVYTATFQAKEAGLHRVTLTARDADGVEVGRLDAAVLAQADDREFLSPRYNPGFLKRLAAHTGGQFVTLDDLDQLAEKIPWTDSAHARLDRFPLWHRPPFYVVIVLLLCFEWYLRRTQGEP